MRPDVVVATRGEAATAFVARFEAAARNAIATHARFVCAVPGGSVADAFFPRLARADVDWRRVEVFWSDERAVAPAHPDSNYGVARRLWLDRVPVDASRVHPMDGASDDLDASAAVYERTLRAVLGGQPIDLALLGMGPDGHVCSLFPGRPATDERARMVVAVHDSPKPPPARLTLTLAALAGAGLVCVAAFGAEKAPAVREAVEESGSRLPVALAARAGAASLFLLDAAAAGLLRQP